jgi:hypothetical protein
VYNETIDVFAGSYDEAVSGGAGEDIDEVTNHVVAAIRALGLTSNLERDRAIQIIGRLFGETLAHEIVHSLIGATLDDPVHHAHNAHPGIPGDLMNFGEDRSIKDRTGFDLNGQDPTSANFDIMQMIDYTIFAINLSLGDSRTEIESHFPRPPIFT